MEITVAKLDETYKEWAVKNFTRWWHSTKVVTKGKIYDIADLDGLVALTTDTKCPVGLLTFNFVDTGVR